eukprot:scaffold11.g4017.t1
MLAHHPNAVAGQAAAAAGQQAAAAAAADEDAARVAALQEDLGIAELAEDGTTTERRLALVTALRERFEAIASTSATSLFHRASFPALMKVPELSKGSISELVPACHALLTHDHEEHGIVAQRLLFDVHKAYRGQLEEASGPFFEWLKQLYEGLPAAYRSLGLEAGAPPGGATLLPARASFKLASEARARRRRRRHAARARAREGPRGWRPLPGARACSGARVALMIVFLLQCYPKRLQQYASALLPLMVQTAGIPGPELSAVADDRMGLYSDFRMAQIKTLAFLTVMARSGNLSPLMAPHRNAVCEALELMVAVRNVLPTAYRQGLQERIDTLLDERTLLGRGRACMEGLRPVAYSTLAELVASSKADLSYPQLVRVVHIFARNAHDCTLPASLQSTSLRLLYNLIETIFQRRADARTCEAYRLLLSAILDCFVSKLGALRALAPKYIAEVKELDEQRRTRKAADAERAADAAAAAGLHVRRLALEKGALRTRLMEEQRAAQAAAEAAAAGDAPTQPAGAEEAQPPGTEPMQVERPPQAQGAAGGAAGAEAAAGGGGGASEGEQPKQEEAPADAEKEAAEAGAKLKLLDEAAEKASAPGAPLCDGSGRGSDAGLEGPRAMAQPARPGAVARRGAAALRAAPLGPCAPRASCGLTLALPPPPAQDAFRALLPSLGSGGTREKEVNEYRGLLQTVLSCLKSVLYTIVAFHSNRGLQQPLSFPVKPWSTRLADVRVVSRLLPFGLPALAFFEALPHGLHDMREQFADLFTVLQDGRDFADVVSPRLPLLFSLLRGNRWFMRDGKLTAELFELCFEALPRVQLTDAAKASHMAQVGAMPVERVVLPHVMALMQAAFGTSGLHARLVDLSLAVLHGPVASKAEADAAAELCLLVPARLEHLIPPMPRLMHAVAHALASGSDQARGGAWGVWSISCALRVLDLWVDSFNPEFIERSMAGVIPRLMGALWAHVRPHPYPYGAKVAEVLGKLGGRSRRWLAAPQEGEYKPIPEYGLRVILAFPPHTSFLVPLDRCVQFATAALNSPTADVHHRRHALRLLHICVSSLSKARRPLSIASLLTDCSKQLPPSLPALPALPVALPAELAAPGADVLGKLEGLLFSDGEPPSVPQEFHWPNEMGVKTKKQHAAEKQARRQFNSKCVILTIFIMMLEQLLVTTMVASAEGSDLAEEAAPFALATVRHFALLLAVGWGAQAAPPVPPSSRHMRYGAMGGVSACVAILKHLDPRIILDAFQAGLGTPQAGQRAAVVRCMAALVDALLEVGTEQAAAAAARRAGRTQEADSGGSKGSQHNKEKDKEGKESGGGGGSDAPTPAATDAGAAVPADAAAAAAKPEAEGGGAAAKPDGAAAANGQDARADAGGGARDGAGAAPPTLPPRYVAVVHDLLVRSMHCCYGDTWVVRLGGIAALAALAERLPPAVLERPAAHMLKAMLAALRCLPDHAEEQQAAITAALVAILRRALGMAPAEGGGGGGGEGPEEGQTAELEKEKEQKEQEGGEAMDVDGEGEEEGGQRAGSKRGAPRAPAGPPRKQARAAGQEAAGGGADGEGGGDAAAAGGGEGKAAGTAAADAAPAEGAAAADGARAGGGGGGVMPSSPARRQLLEIMTRELVSGKSSDTIRAAAARCLGVLAEAEGLGLSGLLGGMLRPLHFIVERRLLPLKNIAAQSNYAHSMAFVIRTCPAQLELDAEVASFVADAASIMETDDAGISGAVTVRGGPPKPEVLTRLRVACMEALTAALGWEPFRTGEGVEAVQRGQGGAEVRTSLNHLRERIMKIFITELGSSSPRVVGLASAGVKTALDHGLLAKPVLQARLASAVKPVYARPGIVVLTIGLEESLPRLPGPALPSRLWSPYRAPLARFLCRYPEEAVAYFLEPGSRLASESYFVRLLDVIRNPIGAPLLQSLYQALLTRWRAPERKQRIRQEAELPRQQVLESKRLARAILSYVERRHSEVAPLFDLLTIFSSGTAVDFTFLKTFFQAVVAEQYSAEEKRAVLAHWLSLYKRGALAHDDGVTALRLLVTPMVGWAMEHGQADVLTPELVRSLVADVFKNPEEGGASEQVQLELVQLCGTLIHHAGHLFVEHRKELIQFGWWTLKYDNAAKPHAFLCVYVALARLAQTEAGARDAVRQAIDIMIPTLAAVPPEPQGGAKPGGGGGGAAQDGGGGEAFHDGAHPLARAASAASPPRGSGGGGGEGSGGSAAAAGAAAAAAAQAPSYARYLKKASLVLVEEGHSSATLLHIFQARLPGRGAPACMCVRACVRLCLRLIVRNRDRFFSSRAQFMPAMLNSLTRMGLPSNTTLENRLLAVDMAASLLKWDQAAAREEGATGAEEAGAAAAAPAQQLGAAPSLTSGQPGAGGSPAGTEGGGRPPAPAGSKDRLTPGMDEMIVNFLVRMAFVSCDARDRDEAGWRKLHAHCLEVLRDAVRLRPPVALKMHYFEKFLQQNLQQQAAQAATAQQTGQAPPTDPAPALMTGLRIANIFLDYAPDVLTGCAANQLAMMMEPSLTCRHKAPVDLLGACMRKLFSCYPPGLPPRNTAEEMAGKLEARLHEVINKFLILLSDVNTPLHPDMALYACNCVAVMRAAMAAQPDCMQARAWGGMGLLAARAGTPPREEPADSEFGTGAWFMYNALNAAVPSALVLSAEHRRHFLSTLVMLITGQSVRQGQTDPAIMLTVLHMLRTWLLGEPPAGAPGVPGGAPGGAPGAPGAAAPRGPGASGAAMLTSKELLVIMQRVAQVDRMQVIPPALKPRWDSLFLDLLYRAITQPQQHVGGAELAAEVFTRVERTFCCGLQSSDPATRQKDWDFISHTFWLKHGVALLFDSLNLRDPITLAYNSAHVPPLFNFVESLAFPPLLHQQQQQGQQGQAAQQQGQGQQGQAAQGAQAQGEAKPGQPGEVKQEPGAEAPAAAAAAAAVKLEGGQAPEGEAPAQQAQQAAAPQPASGDTAEAAAGAGAKGPSPPPPPPPTSTSLLPTLDLALPPALSSILKEQVEFMRTQTSLRSEALVSCLIEVLLSDPAVAHHLWVLLFPITALAKPIIQLLSKEHHTRQALLRPTVGATLLEGISLSQPQPKIPAEMIKYMGRHFHAWHTAISMLESHVGLFPGDMRCFDAVCELYRVLGEDDMVAGLWARRAAAPETRLALALGQHGFLVPAQQACLELMSRSAHLKQALPKAAVEEGPELSFVRAQLALQEVQRAVELQESWRIMVEFSMQGGPGGAYQDHKVYNLTIRQFTNLVQLAPTMHQMGYRDKAWSVNRLGHIARLHYQPEACCHIINTLYGFNAMEVQEAFVKHQAEMINLKAQFLEALGEADAAQATFSEALTLWSLCPDAWVAWARFCDGRYAACGQASWLEFAGACYTQAVKLSGLEARALVPRLLHLLMLDSAGPEAVGRTLIAQCADMPTWVWLPWVPQLMMSLQRPEVATARRILSVAAGAHPQQLYWHVRPAMMAMKEAAVKAAKQQQQQEPGGVGGEGGEAKASPASGGGAAAKEGDPAAGDDATGGQQQQQRPASPQIEKPIEVGIEVMAYEACRDVVEALRAKLSAPLQVLEQVMAELGQRFLTRTEERLLAVVHTLQQRTYKMALPAGAPVVEAFKRELAGVCKACSAREGGGGPQSRIGQYQAGAGCGLAVGAASAWHVQFARDLDPASPSSPQTLGEMTERLKGWRIMLETVIEDTFPPVMKTENEAPMASRSKGSLDIYWAFPAPDSPDMVYVERCGAEIEARAFGGLPVVRRNCNSFRRLKLYGSDGVARSFLIQNTQTITGSEERIAQLLRNANGLLDAHPESRRRALRFNAPAILVPWAGVRMVEDDPSAVPFLDAYETHCARYGREPDAPILAFKAATCTDQGITADPEVRLQAYVHVVEQYVTENIFSQYMYKTMVENSRTMWTFKKQFALSTAMSAVACHLLLLTGRSPGKVLVSKASGRVGQAELISAYDTRFQLERGHESAFIGPHGMEGLLLAAGAAAAQGLLHQHGSLPSQLALFLRDDILAWAARRSGARSIAALAASLKPAQLDACVNLNVKAALDRTSQLGPASSVTCEGNPQQGMRHLVEAAVAPANLCRMEPTWQPWL